MKIARTKAELRQLPFSNLGFVPTMGAFHEGHLELMRRAKAECGACAVSLFVNPTQFGPDEDYRRYPRREEADFALAASAGVDLMFAPEAEEMYGDPVTKVTVAKLSELWEGASRPGHFEGVATVVAKLFHLVRPKVAYFGLKDFQQCAVLRKMVLDLDFDLELNFVETIRESDGLAMSSRNAYLTAKERAAAPMLFATLNQLRQNILEGSAPINELIDQGLSLLSKCGFRVDYLAIVDAHSLEPIASHQNNSRLIAAAWLGKTRLIDNCAV